MLFFAQILRLFKKQATGTPAAPVESAEARKPADPLEQVVFDTERVVRTLLDGREESVRWDDLNEVRIITTDQGPLIQDVYFLLIGKSGGCAVPSNANGADTLLARLQDLPGFDNATFIESMSSTENAEFLCWKRACDATG